MIHVASLLHDDVIDNAGMSYCLFACLTQAFDSFMQECLTCPGTKFLPGMGA